MSICETETVHPSYGDLFKLFDNESRQPISHDAVTSLLKTTHDDHKIKTELYISLQPVPSYVINNLMAQNSKLGYGNKQADVDKRIINIILN